MMQKQEMTKKNKNEGITLIVLVIIIVILSIFVGIGIATIAGENGFIEKTNEVKSEAEIESLRKKVESEVLKSKGTYVSIDIEELNKNLQNIEGIIGVPIVNLPATVILDGYDIKINEYGIVSISTY